MRMILVDVCREHTLVHRMNVTEGIYERPFYIRETMDNSVTDLLKFMWKDRPNKIVIDDLHIGRMFTHLLHYRLEDNLYMHIDEKGNITYEGEHLRG